MNNNNIYEIIEKASLIASDSNFKDASSLLENIVNIIDEEENKDVLIDFYHNLYYNYWYSGDIDKSKFYFDLMIKYDKKLENEYLFQDYILYYDLPKIYVLMQWRTSVYGVYSIDNTQSDFYPIDNLIFITDISQLQENDLVFSANKRIDKYSIIKNYLKRLKGQKSNLYTKKEYVDKFLNKENLHIAIKNFYKLEECKLVALTIKHFVPSADIVLFNFYNEREPFVDSDFESDLFNDVVHVSTKYLLGMNPIYQRNNGLIYGEAYNEIYKYFSTLDGKLLIIDEHNHFLNGIQLKEIIENDFDFAWAEWYPVPPNMNGENKGIVNGTMIGLNPSKMKDFFPMPEVREFIETVLTVHFLNKDGVLYFKMKTKNLNDYSGDGYYTNDIKEMKEGIIRHNIPLFYIDKNILNEVRLYLGPVTSNVVKSVIKFSDENYTKIGLIASRRQIDYNGGYVNNWTTREFYNIANSDNIILCRDHGGIAQGNVFDNGMVSLIEDSKYFKILHIDPWLRYNSFDQATRETIDNIKAICAINDNCLFEVGTEQAIFHYDIRLLDNFLFELKKELGILFDRIVYCVVQSGTAINGTKNIGEFDKERLTQMLEVCKRYGVKSKEHNGDYLSSEQIKERFQCGLDAINIAPEFGVLETDVILENINDEQKEEFFKICLKSNKWLKWVNDGFDPYKNKTELIRICGHYQFSTTEFKSLNLKLNDVIQKRIYERLLELTSIVKK